MAKTDPTTYRTTLLGGAHNLHELAVRYSPDPGFIIPGWLPAETDRLLISGPAKAGKSWLAHELVFSLGSGLPFLDLVPLTYPERTQDPNDPRFYTTEMKEGIRTPEVTVYVQQENSLYSMENRHRAILLERGGQEVMDGDKPDILGIDDHGIVLLHRVDLNLFDDVHLEILTDQLRTWKARNLVLDSIYRCMPGTLNDEGMAKELITRLEYLMQHASVRVVALHHASTKGDGGGAKHRESMGSTFFTSAWPDLEWRVHRGKDLVTSIDFVARDHTLQLQEIRMTKPAEWVAMTNAALTPEDLKVYLEKVKWTPQKRGKGWTFDLGTQGDAAIALGVSQPTVSRALELLMMEEE